MGRIERVRSVGFGNKFETKEIDLTTEGFVLIKLKTMQDILKENPDAYFDTYSNLITSHGHLTPSDFNSLGLEFHVIEGCGWSLDESLWMRVF